MTVLQPPRKRRGRRRSGKKSFTKEESRWKKKDCQYEGDKCTEMQEAMKDYFCGIAKITEVLGISNMTFPRAIGLKFLRR